MILSDTTILRHIKDGSIAFYPRSGRYLQPASVDVQLSAEFRSVRSNVLSIDPLVDDLEDITDLTTIPEGDKLTLEPGAFVLGSTVQWLGLPADIVARIEGKSSLGRLGLAVHSTAGFIDPGFEGNITLELSNVSDVEIVLTPGMFIAQVSFMQLDRPAARPYGHAELQSKYQGQTGPTASRYGQ